MPQKKSVLMWYGACILKKALFSNCFEARVILAITYPARVQEFTRFQILRIGFPDYQQPIAVEARMPRRIKVKAGQSFQDGTGLSVMVQEVDAYHRVHFSVIEDRRAACAGPGEMSYFAFVRRFTRIDSVEEVCARIKHLGYVASRRVRIYGEEFELLSDPFPQANRIAICARARGDSSVRILGLPVTIVHNGRARPLS